MATFTYEKVETNSIPKATPQDETYFAAEPGIEEKAQGHIDAIADAVSNLADETSAFASALVADGVWTGDSANKFKDSILRQSKDLSDANTALTTAAEGLKNAIAAHMNGEIQTGGLVNN